MLKLQYQLLFFMKLKKVLSLLFIIGFVNLVAAQDKAAEKWVKKQFRSLSMNEKIAQLMVLRAHSNWDNTKIDSLALLI